MVTSGLLVEQAILKAVWRFVTTMHGALCVMTFGEHLMQMWPVDNLDFDDQVSTNLCIGSRLFLVWSDWTAGKTEIMFVKTFIVPLDKVFRFTIYQLLSVSECFHHIFPSVFLGFTHALVSFKCARKQLTMQLIVVSSQVQLLAQMPFLAREQVTSSWTMCSVLVLKPDLWTAPVMGLAFTTVPTLKMLESPVWVSVKSQYSSHCTYDDVTLLKQYTLQW